MKAILEARDRRRERISELLRLFGKPIVVLTLNLPGPEKNRHPRVFEEGVRVFSESGQKFLFEEKNENEAFWVADADPFLLKKATVSLEENQVLGRLWDFDVYVSLERTVDRRELSLPPRRCYLCERPAKECARGQRHPYAEIEEAICRRIVQWEEDAG